VLVTLLVLWVIVVPVLTLAGTYVLSGVLGRRLRARDEHPPAAAADPVRMPAPRLNPAPIRTRAHANRSRDHALIQR
jgi:hypothetical protein